MSLTIQTPTFDATMPADAASDALRRVQRPITREVVLGRNSKVWRALQPRLEPARAARFVAIGHADLAGFEFGAGDRVWVLSYSRDPAENSRLLETVEQADVAEVIYLSSSSTIVAERTGCYQYPRVKLRAETEALKRPNARVLTVGLMYESADELPAGANIATSFDELAGFMQAPNWPFADPRRMRLFRIVDRPFASRVEQALHRLYGGLLGCTGRHPCALRPLDLLLRTLGMRWYGYTFLANKSWISKIS